MHIPYFVDYKTHVDALDHKTHVGFRGGKQEKKPRSTAAHPLSEPGKLLLDYKMHPHFLPKFWGVHLIV